MEVGKKLLAVELLRTLKNSMKYREMEALFGLPSPVLSRYISGKVLPGPERASEIVSTALPVVRKLIKEKIEVVEPEHRVFSDVKLVSDTNLLKICAKIIASGFEGVRVKAVLTKETAGIPVASLLASELGAKLVIARKSKEVGMEEWIETRRIFREGTYTYLYTPKELLKNSRVVICDIGIRTGSTFRALYHACEKARARVVGAGFVITVGRIASNISSEYSIPVVTIVQL